ncbi:MAG: hypothetical protein UHS41_04205 [Lachnospiraceae bacterium]|nr:hypothetical protein [Lachnospiraceae bacterium]
MQIDEAFYDIIMKELDKENYDIIREELDKEITREKLEELIENEKYYYCFDQDRTLWIGLIWDDYDCINVNPLFWEKNNDLEE